VEEAVKAAAALDWAAVGLSGWVGRSQPEPVVDQEPVEAFAAHRLHESFCVGVRDGGADRGADHADTFGREEFVKDAGEPAVASANQEPKPIAEPNLRIGTPQGRASPGEDHPDDSTSYCAGF
jgi:hypothetical protein